VSPRASACAAERVTGNDGFDDAMMVKGSKTVRTQCRTRSVSSSILVPSLLTDAFVVQLLPRIIQNENRTRRHAYCLSYAAEVGSSLVPHMENARTSFVVCLSVWVYLTCDTRRITHHRPVRIGAHPRRARCSGTRGVCCLADFEDFDTLLDEWFEWTDMEEGGRCRLLACLHKQQPGGRRCRHDRVAFLTYAHIPSTVLPDAEFNCVYLFSSAYISILHPVLSCCC
jgi:hypothetical protein